VVHRGRASAIPEAPFWVEFQTLLEVSVRAFLAFKNVWPPSAGLACFAPLLTQDDRLLHLCTKIGRSAYNIGAHLLRAHLN
jgi:hypothetical protein